ncbi:MAG: hypothetical protein SFY81_15000, partial [Verrucomicrobiota bacterium]|nr:hypothetical protein [Verrucomicrobiota bacterium]
MSERIGHARPRVRKSIWEVKATDALDEAAFSSSNLKKRSESHEYWGIRVSSNIVFQHGLPQSFRGCPAQDASSESLIAMSHLIYFVSILLLAGRVLLAQEKQTSASAEENLRKVLDQLPSATHQQRSSNDRAIGSVYGTLQYEWGSSNWFAALVLEQDGIPVSIDGRFSTWNDFIGFLGEKDALVEVWLYGERESSNRRLTASELTELQKQENRPPTFVTARWKEIDGTVHFRRIEFGRSAAEHAYRSQSGFNRQRELQLSVRVVLSARDKKGNINAAAQWEKLNELADSGSLPIGKMPASPTNQNDLWVAAEFEVDDLNNYSAIHCFYKQSDIKREILDHKGKTLQKLLFRSENGYREALPFASRGWTDELELVTSSLPGETPIEFRVSQAGEPNVRRWNVIEFGEPEALRQVALADFALLSAHLEKSRRLLAMKKSNIDLIVEPIIAGLNIGGGVAGIPIPAGELVRLLYQFISPQFIRDVPTTAELRLLFALFAAKERDPILANTAAEFLTPEEIRELQDKGRKLSEAEIEQYLKSVSEE